MAVIDYFNLLVAGKFLEAPLQVFYDLLGQWFWMWIIAMSLLVLYNKTQNYGTIGIVGLIIIAHVFPLIPPIVHLIAYVLLAISITVIIYRTYH